MATTRASRGGRWWATELRCAVAAPPPAAGAPGTRASAIREVSSPCCVIHRGAPRRPHAAPARLPLIELCRVTLESA
jgi:hypothetical protein